ncbi:MAG TPA: TadE/TadG family type IV pilus assembly protein [Xanthobacteraceae bacterium]|nr:TadE/TadG family type IV pilus assembly protein [Xanthobacteraceae bacterium]
MVLAFRKRLARIANRFRSSKHFALCQKGATAIEFALIAAPFLALLVALFETALVFFAERVLDEVTEEASRYILTGQAQQANVTQAGFRTYLCTSTNTAALVTALFNCNNLMINVENYSDFASASTTSPTLTYNANGSVSNTWNYSPGSAGSIVVVQVMYQWPIILGPLAFNLSNLSNGDRLLISTAVFKSEPY